MNILKRTSIIIVVVVLHSLFSVYAAHVYIQAPKTASSNRAPLSLNILLDTEGQTVSGISGTFSFSSELFDIASISTGGTVVSLWAEAPHVSTDNYFDGRTHIVFEGIMPGGFSGVRSAHDPALLSGTLFTVTLTPKASGRDSFLLSNVEIHNYDEKATLLAGTEDSSPIFVPNLTGKPPALMTSRQKVGNSSLSITFNQSELISNSASYIYVNDTNPSRAIDHIEVAESPEYNPESISVYDWKKAENPYVLHNQSRSSFIHVKVSYTNNTYAIETVPPVENSTNMSSLSRILIGILLGVLLLVYYGKNNLHIFSKSHHP